MQFRSSQVNLDHVFRFGTAYNQLAFRQAWSRLLLGSSNCRREVSDVWLGDC